MFRALSTYLPPKAAAFYTKKKRSFDILEKDLTTLFRVFLKTYLVVKFLKWFDVGFPALQMNTPVWLDKRVMKHPIVPPFWVPLENDVQDEKEREKYDGLMKKIIYESITNSIKHRYLGNDHPMRETSNVIDEYLYDNDSDRILTEMKHTTNLEMMRKKIVSSRNVLSKETQSDDREEMRAKLNAKIKPC